MKSPREKFSLFSAKIFFLQKTWHYLSTWDAPHMWLHHGVHLLADMKAAISDTTSWFIIYSSNCWSRSSGEEEEEEEVRSQEVEEEKFCWVWHAKLTILVALRKMFLLANLLIAAEIWRTQCFIIFWTFDFLTSPSTNCNLSLICWSKRFLILSPISPVVEQTAARKTCYCNVQETWHNNQRDQKIYSSITFIDRNTNTK